MERTRFVRLTQTIVSTSHNKITQQSSLVEVIPKTTNAFVRATHNWKLIHQGDSNSRAFNTSKTFNTYKALDAFNGGQFLVENGSFIDVD